MLIADSDSIGAMKSIYDIRNRLGLSQQQLGDLLKRRQASIAEYESPTGKIPVDLASALIEVAAERGLEIDFNHIFGTRPIPELVMRPTYYVKHPDGSFSVADPQPPVQVLVAEQTARA